MQKEEFIKLQQALGWSNVKMAKHLRKTSQSVSNYRTGRQTIPEHVRVMIRHVIKELRARNNARP